MFGALSVKWQEYDCVKYVSLYFCDLSYLVSEEKELTLCDIWENNVS